VQSARFTVKPLGKDLEWGYGSADFVREQIPSEIDLRGVDTKINLTVSFWLALSGEERHLFFFGVSKTFFETEVVKDEHRKLTYRGA
jgi:hypothetical protein